MAKIKTVIFCGGRGSKTIIESLIKYNFENRDNSFELYPIVNAYDDGLSTGVIREVFGILGPSDVRKNITSLLSPYSEHYDKLREFMEKRTKDEDFPERKAMKVMQNLVEGKISGNVLEAKFNTLPENFKSVIKNGLSAYIDFITNNNKEIKYDNFSIMNAVLGGLTYINGGNLQLAANILMDAMPLMGKVLINSPENLYLYAIRELKENTRSTHNFLLDEAEIVAQRSQIRLKRLFLLRNKLTSSEKSNFANLSVEDAEEKLNELSNHNPIALPETLEIIKNADLIIYGPGTQHSSLLPTYRTAGFAKTISSNVMAKKIFISNIGEDFDIVHYSAYEIFENTLIELTQNHQENIATERLFTDILVNRPDNPNNGKYVQPNIINFERLGIVEYFDKPNKTNYPKKSDQFSTGKIRIHCKNFQKENSDFRGGHNGDKIRELILSIMDHQPSWIEKLNRKLSHGAILFDVDETILDVKIDPISKTRQEENLLESPMLKILIQLLEKGFLVCAVTGNDLEKFHKRFTSYLLERLRRDKKEYLISRFEIFGNGAANHIYFDKEGKKIINDEYNYQNALSDSDIKQLQEILENIIKNYLETDKTASSPEEFNKKYNPLKWGYDFDNEKNLWYENRKDSREYLPYIEARANNSMVTIKPLPSERHLLSENDTNARSQLYEKIIQACATTFNDNTKVSIQKGGWSSIDIKRLNVNKGSAIRYYLQRHRLSPQEVMYFGNEFKPGGNDITVIDEISKITVISVNQPEDEIFYTPNIIYGGGRGVDSAIFHLMDLLDMHKYEEENAIKSNIEPEPIIRQKIRKLYREKTEKKWQAIYHYKNHSDFYENIIFSDYIKSLDSHLRQLENNIILLIPAAGERTQLENNTPKPLFQIEGKEAILHVLDNFKGLAKKTFIIIDPKHRNDFEKILHTRSEEIILIPYEKKLGEGDAIFNSLQVLNDIHSDILLVWSDLIISSREKVEELIRMHFKENSALSFLTTFQKGSDTLIERDKDNRPIKVDFNKFQDKNIIGEHDSSFFIIKNSELKEGLKNLHASYYQSEAGFYNYPNSNSKELKFLYLIEELYKNHKNVQVLPHSLSTDFIGFNTMEEAKEIEKILRDQ